MSKEKNFQKYFGVPLEELLSREKGVVPKLLQKLAKYLLEHGIFYNIFYWLTMIRKTKKILNF